MTDYGQYAQYMNTWIQANVEPTAYKSTKMWNWFKTMGLIQDIPKGLTKYTTTILEKAEPGKIIAAVSDLPNNTPRLSQKTTTTMMFGTKISVPVNIIDMWVNNPQINISPMEIMTNVMRSMYEQVDSFLSWGDAGAEMATRDINKSQSVQTGLFGGGTTFTAGIGLDDGMVTAGDYFGSWSTAVTALQTAGYEQGKYWLFSDIETKEGARNGAHIYTSAIPTTEFAELVKEPDMAEWIYSGNMKKSTTKHMMVTTPYKTDPTGMQTGLAYRLLQGYNFDVYPLHGGGLSGAMAYEWGILWSGTLDILDANAIQTSGALNLAG